MFSQAGVLPNLRDRTAVEANRAGGLTPGQAGLLARRASESRMRRSVQAAATTVVGILVILLLVPAGPAGSAEPSNTAVLVLVALVVAGAWARLRPWADPLGGDVREGRVEMARGAPVIPRRPFILAAVSSILSVLVGSGDTWRSAERTEIDVEGRRFSVLIDEAPEIVEAPAIRAYYLPRSSTLVSYEPLAGADA